MAIFFYFGTAKSHLDHVDGLQHQAASIFHRTIPFLESRQQAAAIGPTYRPLDKGRDDLKFFIPEFVTTATRISSHLYLLSHLPGYHLTLPGHLD